MGPNLHSCQPCTPPLQHMSPPSTLISSIKPPSPHLSPQPLPLSSRPSMADRPPPHQIQVHPQRPYEAGMKGLLPQQGPSTSQVLAVITLLPFAGFLVLLAGLTFAGTAVGLAVTTPLFLIFSPVIVPAAIAIGLAVVSFVTSGAVGVTGLSSLSCALNNLREAAGPVQEYLQSTMDKLGQKTKDLGQGIHKQAHEGGPTRKLGY